MSFCFLFGVDLLKMHEYVLYVGKGQIPKGKKVEIQLPSADECVIDFAGSLSLGIGYEGEILNDDDINNMQIDYPVVKELKRSV